MAKFVTSLGHTFEEKNHDGKYARILLQRLYEDEKNKNKNRYMPDKYKKATDRTYTKQEQVFDINTGESHNVTDTYLVAVNPDYKEYETVNYYTTQSINTKLKHKVEILLQSEEWKKRLFVEYTGDIMLHDLMSSLGDNLWEEFKEDPSKHTGVRYDEESDLVELMMYTDDGEYLFVEVDSQRDFENMIVSVRVVEFESKIMDGDREEE
ncbi:hypothetical protein PP175_28450 (plasmid) [Aneurinibacillus sp. Ricciae_BoGa-3]|uniref:hypothetical protein n=1 Tax=Aneurinibacillus sp. Ricciae_BoGa-3 TaxID=3022697 RepID=UPI002341559C|nr:hypothetical protein [Aneurinibacillus sp. Ricciae_BoGa-3]WCK57123.1 hypothetical protein PP175_28450 [Aneurinibacillus sp. Ricciae_BoGa-3]